MEELFTVEEAADSTRLCSKTLNTYASQKRIHHIKLGSRLLFDQVKLEECIRGSEGMRYRRILRVRYEEVIPD